MTDRTNQIHPARQRAMIAQYRRTVAYWEVMCNRSTTLLDDSLMLLTAEVHRLDAQMPESEARFSFED